ncbi:MAG: photosynthetic reaction center subunit H, partial [Myxococcota bacterium]
MQQFGAITEYIDVAQVTLYVFWIFFAGLIIYLRREDTREGYPLEADIGGAVRRPNFVFFPKAKE